MADALNRQALSLLKEAPSQWRNFAAERSVLNFQEHQAIRPAAVGNLEPIADGGELKHGVLTDGDTLSYKVDTFGKVVGISRKNFINDELGLLFDAARSITLSAERSLTDLVYSTILEAGNFFNSETGNLITGSDKALTPASLSMAITQAKTRRDERGNDLDYSPKFLLVPPELETTAREILESTEIAGGSTAHPSGNAMRHAATLLVEPRLSNTMKWAQNASQAAWYLISGKETLPLIVAFLHGQKTPHFKTFTPDDSIDRLEYTWKVYFDYGVAMGDKFAWLKSTGE